MAPATMMKRTIPVVSGTFEVVRGDDGLLHGTLDVDTAIGHMQVLVDIGKPPASADQAGRTDGFNIDWGSVDYTAHALNYVLQDAASSGVTYVGADSACGGGAQVCGEKQKAARRVLRAALGSEPDRAYLRDLTMQAETGAVAPGRSLEQVQKEAEAHARVYEALKNQTPWITKELARAKAAIESGSLAHWKEHVGRRLEDRFGGAEKVKERFDHFIVAGAPMNLGQYRRCTGCTCTDPFGSCVCGACGVAGGG